MHRIFMLVTASLLTLLSPLGKSLYASGGDKLSQQPNIVLILVDDLGAVDLGCYGSTYIQTPNLDKLAADGVRATRAYAAAAICSPTRAALMTGKYPARLHVTDWIRARFQRPPNTNIHVAAQDYEAAKDQPFRTPVNPFYLPLDELTLGEYLRGRGYHTAHIGKWHLGDDAWYPEHQGYDVNLGGCDYGQPPSYFDPFNQPNAKDLMLRAGIPGIPGTNKNEFLTQREVSEAIRLMENWKDGPFYIQLCHYAVHTPIQAPAELTKKYERPGKSQQQAKYAALVQTVDDGIGRLRAAVEQMKFERPTIFIFTSDNGGLDQAGTPTDNAPLRDGKGSPYEGGIRVPFIVWAEGGLIEAGQEIDTPICSIDVFPTIRELIGDTTKTPISFDGMSIVPALKGEMENLNKRRLVWHFPHYRGQTKPYSIIQENDWKLIHHYGDEPELFHLDEDPNESRNVAAQHDDKTQEMTKTLMLELSQMGALLPTSRDKD